MVCYVSGKVIWDEHWLDRSQVLILNNFQKSLTINIYGKRGYGEGYALHP